MIEIDRACVTFNPGTALETPALRQVSLTVPAGQFVTVIGSNGAGKSTLLNLISGDRLPDSGRINISGQNVTSWPTQKRAKLVARVFQNPLLGSCAHLTVEENMALAVQRGGFRGLKLALPNRRRAQFREQLARLGLGLERRLGDRMGLLSGGQRQAVSLLMSTLAPTQVLLLDEHTAALDPKTADFVLQLTRQMVREQHLTTVMVTHSMSQALLMGDRTIMLHEGQIILDIAGEELEGLEVADLLERFNQLKGEELVDDSLLLG